MAKLTQRFFAVPDGAIYPRWFEAGDEVTGDVERAARIEGLLEPPKRGRPPKSKAMGAAPENKASD